MSVWGHLRGENHKRTKWKILQQQTGGTGAFVETNKVKQLWYGLSQCGPIVMRHGCIFWRFNATYSSGGGNRESIAAPVIESLFGDWQTSKKIGLETRCEQSTANCIVLCNCKGYLLRNKKKWKRGKKRFACPHFFVFQDPHKFILLLLLPIFVNIIIIVSFIIIVLVVVVIIFITSQPSAVPSACDSSRSKG